MAEPKPTALRPTLVDELAQLSFAVHDRVSAIAATHDHSVTSARLLGILRDREPTMLELARVLGLGKSSMSGLVARAEARGLVERFSGHSDGRVVRVRLTAKGQATAKQVAGEVGETLGALLAELSTEQQSALAAALAPLFEGGTLGWPGSGAP